jgi:hypothetical protein
MADNIKEVYDKALATLVFDKALAREIHEYGQGFVNLNEDHVAFFGGNLLGVHPVRFKSTDKFRWNEDLLGIDEHAVRADVIALPTIDKNWVRGTDVMNLSCLYITHRYMKSALPDNDKRQAMIDVLLVLHYKFFSSLMAHFFKYPADEATALATYAALSKKYAIKQHGNWQAVFIARCEDIIDPMSIHYRTIQRFDDDAAIQYMVTDLQGRLRSIVKNIWATFDEIRNQNSKILSIGGTIELDGKVVIKDVTRNYTPYVRYLHEIAIDRGRFIKPELIDVIESAMQSMPGKMLFDTLQTVVTRAGSSDKDTMELLDETLLHAFEYLSQDRSAAAKFNDIPALIGKLRALYMASRTQDPAVLKMRELAEAIVADSIKSINQSIIASVRTGLLLYIVLRSFSRSYYN